MSDDTLRTSFFAEAIPKFRLSQKFLPPRPLPLTKSHISPVSAFLSKLKPSLLACSAASSLATLLHAARPHLSRQVIHTRPPSSSSFHIPHAPTDSATPSTKITIPLLQLSATHSHFARSITWSSVACGRTHARGRYGCHACRPPDLGGAPRLGGHHRHRHAVVYFKIQFVLFSRGHRQCLLVICPL